nr:reverse transcriptase domain-containing protein [Tanacetum cinerariifolium]
MATTIEQQVAMDEALVPSTQRNTKAYKEYYAFSIGETVPKPKASARRKMSDSDTSITPPATTTPKPTVVVTPRLTAAAKGKQTAKSLPAPSEVARTETQQLKIVLRRSRQQMHISQPGGYGTDEGTGSKLKVPDVPTDESEEELSWNSSDDEGTDYQVKDGYDDEGDEGDESDEGEEDADEDKDVNQEAEDAHVTLTLINSDGQQESSSVSSQFVTNMLNLTSDAGMESIFATASSSVAPLPYTVTTITTTSQAPIPPTPIQTSLSEYRQTNPFAEAISNIPGIVHQYMNQQMTEAVRVSVNAQLEAEVLTRSSHSSRTSSVAADLSEMELKKILIEKMEGNKSIQCSDEQRNLYKALVDAYEVDKIILDSYGETVILKRRRDDDDDQDEGPSAGSDRGSKRRREGKEPESASAPLETATRSEGRSTTGSKSQQASASEFAFAEEPVQTTSQIEEPSHLVFETGRHVIPFAHFINNNLEYLRGGASSRKYTTSVTKTKVADYGNIKWIEDLVPRTMWTHDPIDYDKHALWGVSHWGRKRQQFYGFAVNQEPSLDVYSKRRIIAFTDLKIVEWHSYKHLDWILVRRDDDKIYKVVTNEVAEWVKAGIVRPVKYPTYISNQVMVKKGDGTLRMCIDFKNLNLACPKDFYPLSNIDFKVESVMGFKYKCFLDAYKGYYQIQMAEEDEEKTAFYTDQGTYCYTKMPFGLKNTGATYQRLVDSNFQSQIGRNLEAYVDDMVIKSRDEKMLLAAILETFDNLKKINMKLNPKKCSFGVEDGKTLNEAKKNYAPMEKLALSLIHMTRRLRRYFEARPVNLIIDQPIKNVLNNTKTAGKLSKYTVEIGAYNITFIPHNAVKGKVLADILSEAPEEEKEESYFRMPEVTLEKGDTGSWTLFTDEASSPKGSGAGLVLIGPSGIEYTYALHLTFPSTNNEAEYKALLAGLRIARQMNISNIEVKVDSKLVASQINGSYEASNDIMIKYLAKEKEHASGFKSLSIENIPRNMNHKADVLSKLASVAFNHLTKEVLVEVLNERSTEGQEIHTVVEEEGDNWMTPIRRCLEEGIWPKDKNEARCLRVKIGQYAMESRMLFKKGYLVPMLRCVGPLQANYVIQEIHMGSCGMHVGPRAVVRKGIRQGYYWPTMDEDAKKEVEKCDSCQIHASVPRLLKTLMTSIIAPCPFYQLGMDILGPLPPARGGAKFVIVAIDYFTKWIEAKPLVKITSKEERREAAAVRKARYKTKMEQYYNKKFRSTCFRPGEFVFRRNEASRTEDQGKLGPKWEGPYRVMKVYKNGSYMLQTLEDKEVPRTWHAMNLRKCYM